MADWYVQNVREFPWFVNEKFGARGFLVPFDDDIQVGVRIHVLEPGKPSTMYHRETGQEGFLVVEGELLLIVEGEERTLKQWDYFHCPPGTTHAFVGAGVEEETDTPDVAYAPFPKWEDGYPESWAELPWNRGA